MAIYTAAQIYAFARQAGFSPDQAVTMTAVALAESGGNGSAHASHGEDSRGLWQINLRAHPQWSGLNAYDPLTNARLAFQVSGGGRDISPWTTTHGVGTARYLSFRSTAQQAALSYGDQQALGNWAGTAGYGHPASAAGHDGSPGMAGYDVAAHDGSAHGLVADVGGTVHGSDGGQIGATTQRFLEAALAQAGDKYVYGAEANLNDPDPKAFDCSELTQWAANRAGVTIPDGAAAQYDKLSTDGRTISVDQALHTPGALLFHANADGSISHVAISLGDGRTIEARNSKLGVGVFDNRGDWLNRAAVLPGLSAPVGTGAPAHGFGPASDALFGAGSAGTGADGSALDSDHDGLSDALEQALGTNPHLVDTDHDGLSDSYELLHSHTDARVADTNHDGLTDAVEIALGRSATDPARPGAAAGQPVSQASATLDSDHDGLTDALERALGTDAFDADTDHDGVSDGIEHRMSLNPLDAHDVAALLPPGVAQAGTSADPDAGVETVDAGHDDLATDWAAHSYPDQPADVYADPALDHDHTGSTGSGDVGHHL
jgi:cell wall-associated NlpC family hydrolase